MTATSLAELSDINVPNAGLVARATDLVPLIRKFAGQGSEARRVAPEVVSALEGAGLFRMLVPKRYGGMGASLCTAVEVTKEISRGDGSTGWVTTLMMVGTGFASTFPGRPRRMCSGGTRWRKWPARSARAARVSGSK